MPFTFIDAAGATIGTPVTTLDATTSLNVAAGDVLVVWCAHDAGGVLTYAVAKNSGSPANAFTFDAGDMVNHSFGKPHASFGYLLNAAADAAATFRLTLSGTGDDEVSFIVMQFRPDAGETVTKDISNVGQGTGDPPVSGNITTTGTDEIVCGADVSSTGVHQNELINGVAATVPAASPKGGIHCWYRILTATFAAGNATEDFAGAARWICNIIAIKSVAAGGAVIPVMMNQYRQRGN